MNIDTPRRSLLKLLPLAVVFASIGGAAFRFLRPRIAAATGSWLDVASVSELTGPQPISRKIVAEHEQVSQLVRRKIELDAARVDRAALAEVRMLLLGVARATVERDGITAPTTRIP